MLEYRAAYAHWLIKAAGLVVSALICTAVSGQGTILFNTRVPGIVDAPAFRPDLSPPGPGVTAALFLPHSPL